MMEIEPEKATADETSAAENNEMIENNENTENVETQAEQIAAETLPPPDSIHEPEKPRRSWFGSILHFLFSADTAVGRLMRPLLRWAAFVLVVFSLGALAMYFWRVQPAERVLAGTMAQLMAAQNELSGAREKVSTSQTEMSAMQERLLAAETTAQTASQQLLLTTLRNDIAAARVALIADKDVAAAILNLSAADLDLKELTPTIDKINPTLAGELQQHLTRIQKGLNTRPVNQAGLANELFAFDVKLLGLAELMFPQGN